MTEGSSQAAKKRGCGTSVPSSALSTRASRSIVSLLLGLRCLGGRRRMNSTSPRSSRNTAFASPPVILRAPVIGPDPGRSWPSIQSLTLARSSNPSNSSFTAACASIDILASLQGPLKLAGLLSILSHPFPASQRYTMSPMGRPDDPGTQKAGLRCRMPSVYHGEAIHRGEANIGSVLRSDTAVITVDAELSVPVATAQLVRFDLSAPADNV